MPLKFGSTATTTLKLGSSSVTKLYFGASELTLAAPATDASYSSTKMLLHLNNSLTNTAYTSTNTANLYDLGTSAVTYNTGAAKFGTHGLRFTGTPTGSEGTNDQEFGRLALNNSLSALPANWTFELWVKPASTWSSGRKQIAAGGDRYYTLWDLYMNGTTLTFSISWYDFGPSDTASVTVSGSVSGGLSSAWHYVSVTRSGSAVTLFLDGTQVGTGTITSGGGVDPTGALTTTSPLTIGAALDAGSGNWQYGAAMDVDEVRVTHATRTITSSPTAAFPDS